MPIQLRRVGYVFQDSRLFPHLSVKSNLAYGYRRARGERKHELDAVVALLGIGELLERRTHNLSGGERQRIAIGRALLAQPELLLMDEPLSSLDPPRKSELLPYIERLRDVLGLPILYISHAFNEVVRLADHLLVVDGGRVVRSGPLLELASDPELSPLVGRFESGSVIECTVLRHDTGVALSTLAFTGGELRVPQVDLPIGERLRVRIRARDVAMSLSQPVDISISNRLPGRILEDHQPGRTLCRSRHRHRRRGLAVAGHARVGGETGPPAGKRGLGPDQVGRLRQPLGRLHAPRAADFRELRVTSAANSRLQALPISSRAPRAALCALRSAAR